MAATALAARALEDSRSALARCATLQSVWALAEAACLDRLFYGDADDVNGEPQPAPYGVGTCQPGVPEQLAGDLRRHPFAIEWEIVLPCPAPDDVAGQDFLAAHELDDLVADLWAQHHAGTLDFELVDVRTDLPVRDDDTGARAGEVITRVLVNVEAFDG